MSASNNPPKAGTSETTAQDADMMADRLSNNPPKASATETLAQQVEAFVVDMNGVPRGKLVDGAALAAGEPLRLPLAVFFQCVNGDYAPDLMDRYNPKDGDMLLRPDPSTAVKAPWQAGDCGLVICATSDKAGAPLAFDPRNVLQRVLARYAEQGFKPVVAPEVEFHLLAPPKRRASSLAAAAGRGGLAEFGGEAFSTEALDKFQPFLSDLRAQGAAAGLPAPVRAIVHEMGPAQIELNLSHGDALSRADGLVLLKRLAKGCALRHGHLASFMAKPLSGWPGSGMHLHCSLVDERGANLFALQKGEAPAALRHFIGGLQTYLPGAFALIAPNPNSYRRFVPHLSAPINLEWGYDNRTVGFRVPSADDAAGRVENRIAGADANPYLLIAATLACGLLGLQEQLTPSPPFAEDAYELPGNLPQGLDAALSALVAGDKLTELLDPRFVEAFVAVKRQELRDFAKRITRWEVRHLGSLL